MTQGLGLAVTEYFDWHNGVPTDPNLKDYPIAVGGDDAEDTRRVRRLL